ncbi:pachytene checkpoint protein 2 [Nannizzia gypsea CBS 118893]|uniref:Pachytene checkpoint protein 2 n=1 Tax=Arthroderma gypseum (strain ATCC MYA-4604 / CBS 118893) TaxID=535722 RepID=E4UZM5_ARTGP|nr:pachytene checkpoint protein 2 [Nannizzia gypsea CBS 118893]EFR03555.1 pachytene checkpoint protein 2 [Nannizzia gypsea CBS 118893]
MGQPAVRVVNAPVLHVEARLSAPDGGTVMRTDIVRDEVAQWLTDNFAVLSIGQEIKNLGNFKGFHSMYLDSIKVMECSGKRDESETVHLNDVNLDIQPYQLRASEPESLSQNHGDEKQDESSPQARVMSLPNKELDGIWESLLFDQPIHTNLLHAISRMLGFSWRKLDHRTITWNRLILLYGPPGTGKTSLCRSLAQKLSIRLGRQFPHSKLVEINAYSLGSKYFSESGKLVAKMFGIVESMLENEPDTLVSVFIDEVETMTAQREQTLSGNDPLDAMRAVNSLLVSLDRLRQYPNVVVFCTSNLLSALDSAFLDRVDIKQLVPPPSELGVYEIFRSCLESLSKCGLVEGLRFDVVPVDPTNTTTELKYVTKSAEFLLLPSYGEMQLWYQLFPSSIPKQLADIARMSVGLSGRSLRRIPALSLVLYTSYEVCPIDQAIAALKRGVKEELKAKREAGGEHQSRA